MKKKIITIGIAGMLLLISMLVTPIISAKNCEILSKNQNDIAALSNSDLKESYYQIIDDLNNERCSVEGFTTLYDGISSSFSEIFGDEYTNNLDILFDSDASRDDKCSAMRVINNFRINQIEGENKDKITLFSNLLEDAKDIQSVDDFDFPEDYDSVSGYNSETMKARVQEILNYIQDDYLQQQENKPLKTLIQKICSSFEQDITISVFILICIYVFVFGGFAALALAPTAQLVLGAVEGLVVALGVTMALDVIGIIKGLDAILPRPQGMDYLTYNATIAFVIGGIAFIGFFAAFTLSPVVVFLGGGAAALSGVIAIYEATKGMPEMFKDDGTTVSKTPLLLIREFFNKLLNKEIFQFRLFMRYC